MDINYNEVMQFMKKFEVDLINRFDELIIDEPTNTYVSIKNCKDIKDVEIYVVFALCRPIGKGLSSTESSRLLNRVNKYFDASLSKEDMRLMYQELCYASKLDKLKDFIKRGFPIEELKKSQ